MVFLAKHNPDNPAFLQKNVGSPGTSIGVWVSKAKLIRGPIHIVNRQITMVAIKAISPVVATAIAAAIKGGEAATPNIGIDNTIKYSNTIRAIIPIREYSAANIMEKKDMIFNHMVFIAEPKVFHREIAV